MIIRIADWKFACVAAFALLVVAVFVVFVIHPGGFEGQIGWFFGLLPGAIVGASLADMAYKMVPLAERIIWWCSTHLSLEGAPPKSLPKIQTEQFVRVSEDREVNFIFDIPIRVAQEPVGFRHDEAVERTFEVLRSAAGSRPKWKFW